MTTRTIAIADGVMVEMGYLPHVIEAARNEGFVVPKKTKRTERLRGCDRRHRRLVQPRSSEGYSRQPGRFSSYEQPPSGSYEAFVSASSGSTNRWRKRELRPSRRGDVQVQQ
jgi:hypothetical protein